MPAPPRTRRVLCLAAVALGMLSALAPAALADSGDPLAYYGGPVAHSMTSVLVDWGPNVRTVFTDPTSGDPGLLKYLASQSGSPGDIGGVLAQYLDSSGINATNAVSYGGQFQISPSVSSTTVQDSQIGAELVAQIGSGVLPHPPGDGLETNFIVLFPPGTTVCDDSGCSGEAFCSYHGSTQLPDGTSVLYLVIPDDTTGPMTQGCGDQSPLRNQTMYLSHEWAESITDPLVDGVTALAPPLAWYDANCPRSDSLCGEVADKCNQEPVAEGAWTVQLVWSNLDAACVGAENRYGSPSVTFTVPQGSPGAPLSFSASASDPAGNTASASWNGQSYAIQSGIASLSWNWGDGSPPTTGAAAVHTFATPGVYDVSVTATDTLGFTGTSTQPVAVWGAAGEPAPQTGQASTVRKSSAVMTGTIAAGGPSVAYRFDYGSVNAALTRSTTQVQAPAATTAATVTQPVFGLHPGTTYFYRLDVVLGGRVLTGQVGHFTTLSAAKQANPQANAAAAGHSRRTQKAKRRVHRKRRRPQRSPLLRTALARAGARSSAAAVVPVTASVVAGQTLARALANGLLVRFRCEGRCRANLQATLALPPRLAIAALPRVLATGVATGGRDGAGFARLRFSSSARAWLSKRRTVTFDVLGFAPARSA
jgi:PKD repeat protein